MPFNTQVLRKTAPWVGGGIGAGLLGTLLSRASNVQYENPDIMEEFKDFGHKPVLGVPGSIAAATGLGAYKTLRKIQKDKMPATMPEDAPTAWESTQP